MDMIISEFKQFIKLFIKENASNVFSGKQLFGINLICHEIGQLKKVYKLLLKTYARHIFFALGQQKENKEEFDRNSLDFDFFVFHLVKNENFLGFHKLQKNTKFDSILDEMVEKKFSCFDCIGSYIGEILILLYN